MTLEETIIDYLNTNLTGVTAYGQVPTPKPNKFVTVERLGSQTQNKIIQARLAVQSWALNSLYDAADLNETVKGILDNAITLDSIMKCKLDTDYNFTDTEEKHYRYQAVFLIVYNL